VSPLHVGKKVCKGRHIRRPRSPCFDMRIFLVKYHLQRKGSYRRQQREDLETRRGPSGVAKKACNSCQPLSTATTGVLQCAGRYTWLSFMHALSLNCGIFLHVSWCLKLIHSKILLNWYNLPSVFLGSDHVQICFILMQCSQMKGSKKQEWCTHVTRLSKL